MHGACCLPWQGHLIQFDSGLRWTKNVIEDEDPVDGIMGSYTSSKGGVKVTISLEDDAVRVNNPGYEKAYSIDDFYRGGNCYYYGLTGSVAKEDGNQVIRWSNGVTWTKTD